jgi:hypothetical protein
MASRISIGQGVRAGERSTGMAEFPLCDARAYCGAPIVPEELELRRLGIRRHDRLCAGLPGIPSRRPPDCYRGAIGGWASGFCVGGDVRRNVGAELVRRAPACTVICKFCMLHSRKRVPVTSATWPMALTGWSIPGFCRSAGDIHGPPDSVRRWSAGFRMLRRLSDCVVRGELPEPTT